MLHVSDIRRSIHFYRLLGLELMDYEGDPACPGWARMHGEGGDLMFLLAETPMKVVKSPFFLYLYTDELAALREHLLGQWNQGVGDQAAAVYAKRGNLSP